MFNNDYIVALYGWALFNVLLLGFSKDKDDDKKRYFNFRIWWRYHWDNVLITFFAIPAMVYFSEDLWSIIINGLFSKPWEYVRASLMGAVPFVQLVYFLFRKVLK